MGGWPTSRMSCPPEPDPSGSAASRSTPTAPAAPQWSSFPPALCVRPGAGAPPPPADVSDRSARCAATRRSTGCARVWPRLRERTRCRWWTRTRRRGGDRQRHSRPSTTRPRWRPSSSGSAPGELDKVVLAREVTVEAPARARPAALYGALRELFPTLLLLLLRLAGGARSSERARSSSSGAAAPARTRSALAGSTRRSADPSVDDHLGEQLRTSAKDRSEHEIVVRRIERALRPYSVWVEAAPEPELVKVANIQHLGTPIHAQLAEPRSAVDLAGRLHPTPAVGGEPRERALQAIAELESLDRGWYAGPVGWMDAAEDGEFCVALRSALLRDRTAHLFAGNDSERRRRDRGQARGAAGARRLERRLLSAPAHQVGTAVPPPERQLVGVGERGPTIAGAQRKLASPAWRQAGNRGHEPPALLSSCSASACSAVEHRALGPRPRRAARHSLSGRARGLGELGVGHHAVDEAELVRLRRAEGSSLEDHLQCARRSQDPQGVAPLRVGQKRGSSEGRTVPLSVT